MTILESQNKYPSCLLMSLEMISLSENEQKFDLYLTLNFQEESELLLNGQINFGLKGGDLKLSLHGVQILSLNDDFSELITVTHNNSLTPSWHFTSKTNDLVLNKTLKQQKLATVQITDPSYLIEADFKVSGADIYIKNAEGLWRHDISPNKHGILERKLAFYLLENDFTPYLSLVKISPDGQKIKISSEAKKTDNNLNLSELATLISRIYEAKTDDFLELAALAKLNIQTDLAGANLLATDLKGLCLSGCNLYHVNFRGGNLTDIDLSEANLSYAKLSGADLSGAFLGNADLSYSDLHRASLALTNLIGANLTAANLTDVNLTNANLSGAKVTGTKFSNNEGISELLKTNLQARGAIFI